MQGKQSSEALRPRGLLLHSPLIMQEVRGNGLRGDLQLKSSLLDTIFILQSLLEGHGLGVSEIKILTV